MMKREFVSYPKSGRSWIRYMLVLLGHADNVRFHHDGFEFNDARKPPLNFDLQRRIEQYGESDRVIYLERDPRDVMVSLYHQVTGRFRDFFDYRGSISDFMRDPYFGAHNLGRFRDMWHAVAADRGFMTITYEECHKDSVAVLSRSLDYLGLRAEAEDVHRVVKEATIEKMRQIEESDTFAEPWLRKRNGAAKVRRGVVGGFRTELDLGDIDFLNEIFGCQAQ